VATPPPQGPPKRKKKKKAPKKEKQKKKTTNKTPLGIATTSPHKKYRPSTFSLNQYTFLLLISLDTAHQPRPGFRTENQFRLPFIIATSAHCELAPVRKKYF